MGWNSSQTTGVTALEDGTSATVTVSFAGAASPTPDNLKNIDASFYKGFAFQQWSAGAANATSLNNFMRMDFQFSSAVSLDNFLINDIDLFEVIQVEGWATSPGAPASGIAATYDMGDKLQSYSLGGLAGVTPKLAYPGNTTLDPESAVGVSFGSQVKAMSVYYSKQVSTASPYITAGIGGNLVVVHSSNPRLYYTYNLNNDSDEPVPVDFFDSLPGGLTWDTSYTPVMTGGLGLDVVYSNGDKDVAIAGLQMPPGNSALTLRTLETTLTGTIDNTAVITPAAETGLDPITANASLNLAPSAPLVAPPVIPGGGAPSYFGYGMYATAQIHLASIGTLNVGGGIRSETSKISIDAGTLNLEGDLDAAGKIDLDDGSGTVVGDMNSETAVEGIASIDHSGSVNIGLIGNQQLYVLPAPTGPSDPNYAHPITIINGDYTIDGPLALSGTIFVTGQINIASGQSITGSGALVAGGQIHFSGVHADVGGGADALFLYSLDSQIHFADCNNIVVKGVCYAPDGQVHFAGTANATVAGGIYAGSQIHLASIAQLNVGAGSAFQSVIPPGIKAFVTSE